MQSNEISSRVSFEGVGLQDTKMNSLCVQEQKRDHQLKQFSFQRVTKGITYVV